MVLGREGLMVEEVGVGQGTKVARREVGLEVEVEVGTEIEMGQLQQVDPVPKNNHC